MNPVRKITRCHSLKRLFESKKGACHPMAQKEYRDCNTDTADNDKKPLRAEYFIEQQAGCRAESQVVAVINNRQGIRREKTEQQRKKNTARNHKNKGAENISALKLSIYKEVSSLVPSH
jgi:hypothetical protein